METTRLERRLYYRVKPWLPDRVRVAVRRWHGRRLRRRCGEVWPILETAGRAPSGWRGWPGGHSAALVLSHDVEGPAGLARVRRLAELEMRHGFRSSFNFVPEGAYRVPPELRAWLVGHGFEIGVHDLRHDGRLYESRERFRDGASRINRYLREWGAVGFRSGFMFHDLDWQHDLDVLYDSSTFDTDPFEPQPDGVGTVFPFWVPRGGGEDGGREGYVEIPYTLPQDSTLFGVLGECDTSVWSRKLEWIISRGGMVSLAIHPDYLEFDGGTGVGWGYDPALYEGFLERLNRCRDGMFWRVLPRNLASWVAETRPVRRRSLRVGMISYSYYESDNRVMRYAEALESRGDSVVVSALGRSELAPCDEQIRGVKVARLQTRAGKTERGKWGYLSPILKFWWRAMRWAVREHRRVPFDVIHVHNVPDFLVFAAWYPRWCGVPVILDIHDIVPEFFASKFNAGADSALVRGLRWMERVSAMFAHHVIVSNHLWLEKYVARSAPRGKCSALVNHADERLFHPRERVRRDDRKVVIFPGGLQWHQGLDVAIRAFVRVRRAVPEAEFHLYGDGGMKEELMALAGALLPAGVVRFFDPVPLAEVAAVMAEADVGVVPKRADSFGNEAYSTKIMEFLSLGIPVVVSETAVDRFYFEPGVVQFFPSGDEERLALALIELLQDGGARERLAKRGREYAGVHGWGRHRSEYLGLVDRLARSWVGEAACGGVRVAGGPGVCAEVCS